MFKNSKYNPFRVVDTESDPRLLKIERRTFKLHTISQIINGIALGILSFQDIILKKSLFSSDFEVAMLIFLSSSSFLFSIYGVEIIHRAHNTRKAIVLFALISRSFLFLIPFFETPVWFIFCIAAMNYSDALLKPFWNYVLKHNYSDGRRSLYFSYASSFNTLFLLISATLLGFILDADYRYYKILFPMAGILDIFVYINMARLVNLQNGKSIPTKEKFSGKWDTKLVKDITMTPLRTMRKIFRENKRFFRFEKYFMMYGISFMMMSIAIPIYLVETLKLGYIPISTARGLVFNGAVIIGAPIMGKLFHRGSPMKFTGVIFIMLAFYPLFLLLLDATNVSQAISIELMVYTAFFIYGFSMSGINITWTLSSIHYAPPAEVSNYQAVHITLTGIRGVFSPFLGYAILKLFSVSAVFIISAIMLLYAGFFMIRIINKENAVKVTA